jgi:CDP-diacylglycerol--glycerol-3-phosphate 3-phosphatidyltransferase
MSALTEKEFKERWSALHGGAPIKGAVASWLSFSYQVARVCTALKFTPNFLTLLGLATAVAMAFSSSAAIALLLLVVSLFFDGIDGSVAIVQGRESKWGAVLDSIADRISEACWLYFGWTAGIPAWAAILMWTIASTQEYARARLASLGHFEIGVVTATERPVRAIFLALVLIIFILDFPGVTYISYAFIILLLVSFMQVMRVAKKTLS